MKKFYNKGVTQIELVVTITLMGIMATTLMGLMSDVFRSYMWTMNNAALTSDIDSALQLIESDLRRSVPFSARNSSDYKKLEMLFIDNTFVHQKKPDGATDYSVNMVTFQWDETLSSNLATDLFVSGHNASYAGRAGGGGLNFDCPQPYNAYVPLLGYTDSGCPASVPTQVNKMRPIATLAASNAVKSGAAGTNTVTFNFDKTATTNVFSNIRPPSPPFPAATFLYATYPVMYSCEEDNTLRRYDSYALSSSVSSNPNIVVGSGDVVLSNITPDGCKFMVDSMAAGFVDIWLQAKLSNNIIDLATRVHVDILP